jgi:hypothetical protein
VRQYGEDGKCEVWCIEASLHSVAHVLHGDRYEDLSPNPGRHSTFRGHGENVDDKKNKKCPG